MCEIDIDYHSVEVQISNISAPKNALININYMCFTKYLTKLSITLIVSTGNRTLHQHETFCSSGSFPLNSSSLMINQCGELIDLNVYWTFIDTDQATSIDCSLFNDSMRVPCPSMPSTLQPGTLYVLYVVRHISVYDIVYTG